MRLIMDYSEIKKMMKDMEEMKLTELSIEFPDGTKVALKKDPHKSCQGHHMMEGYPRELVMSQNVKPAIAQDEAKEIIPVKKEEEDDSIKIVKSPMVGTYYEKPAPDAESYVEVGKQVKKGDILCIIEAMKLMNEIESEYSGEVVEVLVKDGEMVDYGKPLFKIKVTK